MVGAAFGPRVTQQRGRIDDGCARRQAQGHLQVVGDDDQVLAVCGVINVCDALAGALIVENDAVVEQAGRICGGAADGGEGDSGPIPAPCLEVDSTGGDFQTGRDNVLDRNIESAQAAVPQVFDHDGKGEQVSAANVCHIGIDQGCGWVIIAGGDQATPRGAAAWGVEANRAGRVGGKDSGYVIAGDYAFAQGNARLLERELVGADGVVSPVVCGAFLGETQVGQHCAIHVRLIRDGHGEENIHFAGVIEWVIETAKVEGQAVGRCIGVGGWGRSGQKSGIQRAGGVVLGVAGCRRGSTADIVKGGYFGGVEDRQWQEVGQEQVVRIAGWQCLTQAEGDRIAGLDRRGCGERAAEGGRAVDGVD